MLRPILIIVISLLLTACVSFDGKTAREWPEPGRPHWETVQFVEVDTPTNGLFMDDKSARNLSKNLDEMDGNIAKWQALVTEMKLYYKAK